MGQQQAKQIHADYVVVNQLPDGSTLLKHIRTQREFLLRSITSSAQEQISSFLSVINRRTSLHCLHLLEIIQIQQTSMQQMCSLIHKANLIIEYPFKSLQQEIHERSRMKSRFFSEEEVWSIFYSCCSALQTLYEGKITHESLQTKNIYIDKEGLIKLGDPILLGTLKNYIVMMPNNALSIQVRYISPQQQSLVEDNDYYVYDKEKSDVYVLAMIVLEICFLEPVMGYDAHNRKVNLGTVDIFLGKLRSKYSNNMYDVLKKMLQLDPKLRPSFAAILQRISQDLTVNDSQSNSWGQNQNSQTNSPAKNSSQQKVQKVSPDRLTMAKASISGPQVLGNPLTKPLQGNYFQSASPIYIPLPAPAPLVALHSTLPQSTNRSNNINSFNIAINNLSNLPAIPTSYTPYQKLANLSSNASFADKNTIHAPFSDPANVFVNNINGSTALEKRSRFSITNFGKIELDSQDYQCNSFAQPLYSQQIPAIKSLLDRIQKESANKFNNESPLSYSKMKQPELNKDCSPSKGSTTLPVMPKRPSQSLTHQAQSPPSKEAKVFCIEEQDVAGRYEGFKINGKRHGQGRLYFFDGGYYEGQWNQNRMEGFGKLYYATGALAFEGYWKADEFHGVGRVFNDQCQPDKGVFDYTNLGEIGEKWVYYEGEFEHDSKHGRGTIKLSSGELFEGIFNHDVVEGFGTFTTAAGQLVRGFWKDNKLVNII